MEKNFYKRNVVISWSRTAMLICAIFWGSLANADNKQANLQPERLENYLKKIEQAYKLSFVYDATEISKAMILDVPAKLTSVQESLEYLKQKNITYSRVGNQVILKLQVERSAEREVTVSGRVRDKKDNSAMPGVSVREVGARNSVSTNQQGEYKITVKDGAKLSFSFIGYKTVEVAVNGRTTIDVSLEEDANQLKEVNVVSTGYQNLNKKLFTGAATALKGADVKQDGITDVSRMLEGRVAGVSVQNVSGTFGAAPKIRVRGATSITGENKPLWVIDGVILEDVVNISNEQLSSGDVSTLIGSSVAGINADDIESFNILKDAAATAQYGARAMNGVVVITTKKGRIGKPLISYTGNFSTYLKPTYDSYNIMNSSDQMSVYSELARKGWLNHSGASRAADGGVFTKMYQLINTYDASSGTFGLANTPEARNAFLSRYATANTDWFDVLFKNSLMQEHAISVSSGTEKSQLYFSTSYLNDNGWAVGNNVERYTANVNAVFNLSEKLRINFITTGSIRNQSAPGTIGRVSNPVEGTYSRDFDINPFSYALNTSRTLTAFDQNGKRENFTRNFVDFNILDELENNSLELSLLDFKLQGGLGYKFNDHFKYDFLASMRYVKSGNEHRVRENSNMANAYRANWDSYVQDNNRFLFRDPEHPELQPIVVLPYGGFYNTNDDFLRSYMIRNSVEYDNTINEKHLINVFATQETRFANRQTRSMIGYGYQYDKGGVPFIDPNIIKQASLSNLNYFSMNNRYDRFAAFMTRAAYSYDGKYSVNATGRYDGSNQLGSSATARWLPTWNISGAWNIDKEEFYGSEVHGNSAQSAISKILNRATIRATYGLTASLGNATNSAIVLRNGSALRPYSNEVESVMNIQYIENRDLTWEKQYETNIGLDLGFFKDRLNLTVDLYNRNGFDLISPLRTSGIGGQYLTTANYADMNTKGIEVTISGPIIKSKDWNWRSNFNFGYNKNKVTELSSPQRIFDLVTADGGPQQGYPYRGLYSVDFTGLNHDTGIPEFINEKGDSSDNVYMQSLVTKYLKYEGPTDPKLTGGFYNSVSYKGFTFNTLFTFSAGNKIRLNPVFATSYSDLDALPNEFKDRWTLPGDELKTNIPSIVDIGAAAGIDGRYPYDTYNYSRVRVADGGFIRLKQVSLSYAVPAEILKHIGAGSASISAVANNFWLIYSDKKLKGQDPEFFASGGVALPIPKQYTLSLKVGF
ncbi:SusC/RagA family TonB-linked outer membrane protein [Pedobacter endophyticus]|uniref:SusC/RagA family TonB-linked outer membrane protein n=1 Tax=Pedobacter endophyticus TaxID=2789740 RepID=A0A7U3Q4M4_9SPHI|nr:SusC/RagA family TonB-linked outer membrane protein [Pedobacter endophyticus]QPH38515.1 SusC/RagA family TonB-linked outer membrane protein [Pedobacter endophyticus]